MKELRTKLIILSLLGTILGMLISLMIFLMGVFPDDYMSHRLAFCAQFIGSGLFGAVCMGSTVIYDIEHWSLWRATVSHYVLITAAFFLTDRLLGWNYFSGGHALVVLIVYTLIYLFIWVIMYLRWKKEIRQINKELEQLTQSRRDAEDRRP
ncbi:MAG: DUF3021 domain-containing protein [Butyrivibrio sp.]|nr:DUF3021 domain-containing protein [Butyrivibrio sp.]